MRRCNQQLASSMRDQPADFILPLDMRLADNCHRLPAQYHRIRLMCIEKNSQLQMIGGFTPDSESFMAVRQSRNNRFDRQREISG
jgi:hypothetical protein